MRQEASVMFIPTADCINLTLQQKSKIVRSGVIRRYNFVELVWTAQLFFPTAGRSNTQCCLLLLLRINLSHFQRCSSAHLGSNKRLFELLLVSYQLVEIFFTQRHPAPEFWSLFWTSAGPILTMTTCLNVCLMRYSHYIMFACFWWSIYYMWLDSTLSISLFPDPLCSSKTTASTPSLWCIFHTSFQLFVDFKPACQNTWLVKARDSL